MPEKVRTESHTELLTFACPHCRELNIVKVQRIINFSLVASHTLVCAICSKSFTPVLSGPICERPFRKGPRASKVPRRRLSAECGTFTADKASLSRDPAMAFLMLRLGASVNALRAALRMVYVARRTPGIVGLRDLSWTLTMAMSELKRSIDTLLRVNLGVILENARKGGAREEEIEEIGEVLDDGPHSLYVRVLKRSEDWFAGHMDNQSFERWVSSHSADSVVWMVSEGERAGVVVHVAAAAAVSESVEQTRTSEELNLCMMQVINCSRIVARVFQFAVTGYIGCYGAKELPLVGRG